MTHSKFSDIEVEGHGLIALAGAATNNVKQREKLQQYLNSGIADEAINYLEQTAESFMRSVDELAQIIAADYQRQVS